MLLIWRPWPASTCPAVVHVLLAEGQVLVAVLLFRALQAYLQPSELLRLRRAHLLSPAGSVARHYGIIGAPQERRIPTKARTWGTILFAGQPMT